MTTGNVYPPNKKFSKKAYIDARSYKTLYQQSLDDPKNFWADQATEFISWFQPWQTVLTGDFKHHNTRWFSGGKLNACYNCVDRHLSKRADQVALYWQGDDPHETTELTYTELHQKVCRLANVLKKFGLKKGDTLGIYMPMIPEAIIAMLACARIGVVHSVVFGGFSAEALKNRLLAAKCKLVITANVSVRAAQWIPLKENVDNALKDCPGVKTVIVIRRKEMATPWHAPRDVWYHEQIASVTDECPCEALDANDPLFILYTSGSTGTPKGILHTIGGYLVYAAITHRYIFDCHDKDIYWCSADVGWITGHSYGVYGPLCNGVTQIMFEGIPSYPNPSRYWEIIDKYHVTIFYTSPTAIRSLRREGDEWVDKTKRKSLRVLGTVGEPINPEVWEWYYKVVGDSRCPVVDTWWQTETGGILISPLPGAIKLKPGSVTKPFFGIVPGIIDEKGRKVKPHVMGNLVISKPWPGMMQTIYGDHDRFIKSYFSEFPGKYLTGDQASYDEEGYFWISGRKDDVLKVSGHRLGSGELESALLENAKVAEASVVGIPHPIKGEAIYAFVTLKQGIKPSEALKEELKQQMRRSVGPIATPETIHWAEALPKTRSGKIMRRLLRKIANNDTDNMGDTSTLADPSVMDKLMKGK